MASASPLRAADEIRPLVVPPDGRTSFTRLALEATGITFSNRLSDFTAAQNRILENGSGVALGDVDGDGWCDRYFCRLEGVNVLYRNLGGWKFADITAGSGLACPDQNSTGSCRCCRGPAAWRSSSAANATSFT